MTRDRRGFDGAWQIVRLNWPFYAAAATIAVAWPALAFWRDLHGLAAACLWIAWAATLWWAMASIAVSHWVYDRSGLMTWSWVRDVLPRPPARWVNIHSGLDQSTSDLKTLFPGAAGAALDIFDDVQMTEPAIRRAREESSADPFVQASPSSLPIRDHVLDATFLFFAAHELRTPSSREELFHAIERTLAPGGRLLLVEHHRDLANIAAFGPGARHFLPTDEWRRLARIAGLVIQEPRIAAPFVRIWSMSRPEDVSSLATSSPAASISSSEKTAMPISRSSAAVTPSPGTRTLANVPS